MLAFSERYAAQVDTDFTAFKTALDQGSLANSSDENASVQQSLMHEAAAMRELHATGQTAMQPPA
jgi:hypothetical protein